MIIGERLKHLRQGKKVTQKSVAESLNVTEVSYQRYEYGTVRPSLDILIALADYFDVSLDYLVGRSDCPYRLKGPDIMLLSPEEQEHIKRRRGEVV